MPQFKSGVIKDGLSDRITSKFNDIDRIHRSIVKRDAIITFALDGKHSKNSLHYSGYAIDLRTLDMLGRQHDVVKELKRVLGSDYDVVLEHDHIHLEYDP